MTQTKAELLQTRHQGDIRLGDADSTHYVGFKAPATVGTSLVWTLPATDGTANYLLKTDGSGNLGWVADSSTDSTKMPLAGGTFTGDVTFSGAAANIIFDKSDNALEFADGSQLKLGTDNDLIIEHASSNGKNYIQSAGNETKISPKTGEDGIVVKPDGAVELYHDNIKRFETTSTGVGVHGGAGSCYVILKDTDGNYCFQLVGYDAVSAGAGGRLVLADADGNSVMDMRDGGTNIFIKNSLRLDVDDLKIELGANQDLSLFHDGTDSWIKNTNGHLTISNDDTNEIYIRAKSSEDGIKLIPDGAVELYHDNVKKYETTSAGSKFTGGVSQVATAAAALELDLNTSNYFTKTISGNSTFTFANPAASGTVSIFMLELTHSSGTVTWPGTVKWNADTAPTLTTGKTHLFMFVTDDNGSRYRGSALVDYVN